MKKLLGIIVVCLFLNVSYSQAFEKRVTGYADDGVEAWFTFSYSPSDIFSLSFAGSGEAAGVWITKGKQLDPNNTLCLLLTNDPNKKLQNLIMSNFMTNYGLGGTVKVDPQNTRSIVKGEITNTVLYYFLRAAQDSKNTKEYLQNIDCN